MEDAEVVKLLSGVTDKQRIEINRYIHSVRAEHNKVLVDTVYALKVQLSLVATSLENCLSAYRHSNTPPETVMSAEAKLDRIRKANTEAQEALETVRTNRI